MHHISIRDDSNLCWDYIFHGNNALTPSEIVLKMKKAKYLHEYCNFDLGFQIAKNTKIGILNKDDWLALVRRCVLLTTDIKRYPQTWPWELRISPEKWKKLHDVSYSIYT